MKAFSPENVQGTANMGKAKPKNTNTPTLDQYGRDLTQMAEEEKLDPVIGRDKETERFLRFYVEELKTIHALLVIQE